MTKKKIWITAIVIILLFSIVLTSILILNNHKQFRITKSIYEKSDGSENIINYFYDDEGRLLKVTSDGEDYLIYTYSDGYKKVKISNLISDTEKAFTFNDNFDIIKKEYDGHSETYEYDNKNRLVKFSDSTGFSYSCGYDGKKLIYESYSDGDTVNYEYVKNKVVSKAMWDNGIYAGSVFYLYDGNKLMKESSSYDIISYSYDKKGRCVSQVSETGSSMKYTYDNFGNYNSITFSDMSTMHYEYEQIKVPEEIYKTNKALITYNNMVDEKAYSVLK